MALAGETAVAGKIPGERIATEITTSDSATFTTTETEVMTVTAPVVSGRTYAVWFIARWGSDTTGDRVLARLREDDANGTLLGIGQVEIGDFTSALGFGPIVIYAEYTATATGDKTFSGTGDLNAGSGPCWMDAVSGAPAFMFVDYIRDA